MMDKINQPTIIVIFGISGDLAKRSLVPALEAIAATGAFDDNTRIIGLSRRELSIQNVTPAGGWLENHLDLMQLDPVEPGDYTQLAEKIAHVEAGFGQPAQRLFYLSLPPSVTSAVATNLGSAGLASAPNTKLLLEKPFGVDYTSAQDLIEHLQQHFSEEQLYRIDHFLAKEMAQNIILFRAANPLFRHTWNKDFIEKIDVVLSESIDIEGRASFYEQTGAVRDVMQNHVLQLAALTLMDLPDLHDLEGIPPARLKALQQLQTPENIDEVAQRAQYDGYRGEAENPDSIVETFASIRLFSGDPQWEGVPVTLTAGKALNRTVTEICITYKSEFHKEPNKLIIRVQPDEGIELDMWVKRPGYDRSAEQRQLTYTYKRADQELPKAYERVFMDAMRGDHSLFSTSDEILESWRLIDPVLKHWQQNDKGLQFYPKGSDPSGEEL